MTSISVPGQASLGAAIARLAIRASWLYLSLFCLSWVVAMLPGWTTAVSWVGTSLLGLAGPIAPQANGSGDTIYAYVEAFCFAAIAVLGAPFWVHRDRARPSEARFPDWLRILVRYTLGITMISYGMAKVLVFQFPSPSIEVLSQPYGESSPMRLLWTFMGYSPAYSVFGGLAELIGGLLLFFRRTTTLGALMVAAVMTNVVMLNYCYDVPVKLYSSHLLLLAGWLVLPEARRLADVLVFHRPTTPADISPPALGLWWGRARWAIKGLLIVGMGAASIVGTVMARSSATTERPPLYGAYEVESFSGTGRMGEAGARWRRLVVNTYGGVSLVSGDGSTASFASKTDVAHGRLTLEGHKEPKRPHTLSFARPTPQRLELRGEWNGSPIEVRLRRREEADYLLMKRGFHWINESPFNL